MSYFLTSRSSLFFSIQLKTSTFRFWHDIRFSGGKIKQKMMILKQYSILLSILTSGLLVNGQNREWSLQECIDYGVEKSLSMQQRALQNKNDKLDVRDATLSLLPSVSGISPGVSYSFGRGIDPETNTYTNTRYMSVGGFGVGSSLTVFAGFSHVNRLRAAKLSRLMGWEETENQANQIAIQVMNAFFTLLYAEEEVRITREQVENSRLRLKKIEREYELGKKPQSDLFEMQAQQASVEFRLITAQNHCLNAQANLKYIMNYNAEEELKIDARSVAEVQPELHELKPKEVFTQALRTLPEIKLAAYQIRSAELGVYSARAGLYPSISISGSISFGNYSDQRSGDFFSQITDRNQIGKGFSIGMSIPFYSGLSHRSSLQRAKHYYQSSKIQYQQTERALYNEIQQALQDLKSCTQRYRIAVQRENFSTLSYNATRKRYEQGLITIIDLNTTSNSLLEAKYDVLRARLDYVMQRRMMDFYQGQALTNVEFRM